MRGRKRIEGTEDHRASMVGFRYPIAKKDFLNKAYGAELSARLREAADQLIVKAVADQALKSINH